MMHNVRFAGAVLGAFLLSTSNGLACGDKLLVIGRGVRFQNAKQPANIVIYSDGPQSRAILGSAKLQNTLKLAGHKIQIIEGASQLDEVLKSGRVDVILIGLADIAGITRLIQSAPSKPAILPILVKPSKAELASAQRAYKFALNASDDGTQYLIVIDEAMKARLRISAKA